MFPASEREDEDAKGGLGAVADEGVGSIFGGVQIVGVNGAGEDVVAVEVSKCQTQADSGLKKKKAAEELVNWQGMCAYPSKLASSSAAFCSSVNLGKIRWSSGIESELFSSMAKPSR